MKINWSVKGIKIGDVSIDEISIRDEYSVTEITKMVAAGKDIVLDIIKQAPEIMESIGKAEIIEAEKTQEVKKIKWLDSLYEKKPKKDNIDEHIKLVDDEW